MPRDMQVVLKVLKVDNPDHILVRNLHIDEST
jgi:hypothetical protein